MLELIARIPPYWAFRYLGWPQPLPLNLTLSVTGKCNSKCRTCNIWKKPKAPELTLAEWDKIFARMGPAPYWVTLSGGEPFLRDDLVELVKSLKQHCNPAIINIPSNGLLHRRIPDQVKKMLEFLGFTKLVLNLSLDHIEDRHDKIRGVKGNFAKVIKTYRALRQIKNQNFSLGIHTVISRYNVKEIPEIYNRARLLKPDSYITEIAEERVELETVGKEIAPAARDYTKAIDFLIQEMEKEKSSGLSKITKAFRLQYYQQVKQFLLQKRQAIPCYAAYASAQIMPTGDVWACCVRGGRFGNLRDVDYDFSRLWSSPAAVHIRQSIKNRECSCPLANAAYTNMLLNPISLLRVVKRVIT